MKRFFGGFGKARRALRPLHDNFGLFAVRSLFNLPGFVSVLHSLSLCIRLVFVFACVFVHSFVGLFLRLFISTDTPYMPGCCGFYSRVIWFDGKK